ncbi:MAG: hypothetical protein ACLP9C_11320 [Acidimicrobiales bacterium]
MNQFVDQCRREWKRLGVPEAAANEMAADLVADLAEAQADGVSPEEVLGNGFFDPAAFAASWATARGLALAPRARIPKTISLRSLALAAGALVCVVVAAAGLLVLAGPRIRSASVAVAAVRRPFRLVLPPPIAGPHQVFVMRTGGPAGPVGWILLLAGIVGVGIVLWCWRRWSTPRSGSSSNPNVEMPSYL